VRLHGQRKYRMSVKSFDLTSGYDGITLGQIKKIGPTLAIADDWLINHVLLGLDLVPKEGVKDSDVVMEYLETHEDIDTHQIHISMQGLAFIERERLNSGAMNHVTTDDLEILVDELTLAVSERAIKADMYPEADIDEVDEVVDENGEDVEFGSPETRTYPLCWIEAIEPRGDIDSWVAGEEDKEDKEEVVEEKE